MPKLSNYLEVKNLLHDPLRLGVAMGGIGFATLLMFVQLGFQSALYESTVAPLRNLQADIVLVSPARYSLMNLSRFDRKYLWHAGAIEGVEASAALYIERCNWRTVGQQARPIRVLAYDLDSPLINFQIVTGSEAALRAPHTAMIDTRSRSGNYHRDWSWGVPRDAESLAELEAELFDQRIKLVGAFSMGSDFAHDGNLIMSARNFADFFPRRAAGADPLSVIDVGVIRLRPGYQAEQVAGELRQVLPAEHVEVYTLSGYVDKEIDFWVRSTPIGTIFGVGVMVGFVVGVIFCYQIIQTDIADKLAEFATLKAMGYRPGFFAALILRQAFYLSLLGYFPGLLVSMLSNVAISHVTGLVMQVTPWQALQVFLITLGMCVVSGLFVVHKLIRTDPADLF